jgi:hypothetical protein
MRFWQLYSVTSYSGVPLMSSIARSRPEWLLFDEWYEDIQHLCDEQDRAKLDFILPDDYVLAVLALVDELCFRSGDGWIRARKVLSHDETLTAKQVYEMHGGDFLEAIYQYGCAHPNIPETYAWEAPTMNTVPAPTTTPPMHLWLKFYIERPMFEEEQLDALQLLINKHLPAWASELRVGAHEDSPDSTLLMPHESLYQAASQAFPVTFGFSSFTITGSYEGLAFFVDGCRSTLPPELNVLSIEIFEKDRIEQHSAADWARDFFAQVAAHLPVRYGNCHLDEEFDAKNMVTTPEVTKAVGVNIDKAVPGLYWLNYFGIPFVKLMGREVLLSAPAYRVEQVGDGVLIALSETPDEWANAAYRECANAVIDRIGTDFFFSREDPDRKTIAPDFRSELRWRT